MSKNQDSNIQCQRTVNNLNLQCNTLQKEKLQQNILKRFMDLLRLKLL